MLTLKSPVVILLLGLALALQGCGTPAPEPQREDELVLLRLAGSTSMVPLIRELCAAYSAQHPRVSCDVVGVGSDSGLEMVRRDRADLAIVSRELETDEVLDARTGKRLLSVYPIAQDAIAVIVNQRNPVRELDLFSLRRLYQGRISNWSELAGTAGEIVPVSREEGSSTRSGFEAQVMSGFPVSSGAVVMPGSQAVVEYVAQHVEAIGYVSLGYIASGVATVGIDGVKPNRTSLQNGSYPISRPMLLVSLPAASAEASAFAAFARGPRGQAIVSRVYGDPPAVIERTP